MVEKKSILIWVSKAEKRLLSLKKGEQTWREYLLTLAGIPHTKITMGRPRTKGE